MKGLEGQIRIGAASSDGIVVNQHFGRAARFWIYDVDEEHNIRFIEKRSVSPVCEAGNHEEKKLEENVQHLQDCNYILVSRIGEGAIRVLDGHGISSYEIPGIIEESINKLMAYVEIQNLLS